MLLDLAYYLQLPVKIFVNKIAFVADTWLGGLS